MFTNLDMVILPSLRLIPWVVLIMWVLVMLPLYQHYIGVSWVFLVMMLPQLLAPVVLPTVFLHVLWSAFLIIEVFSYVNQECSSSLLYLLLYSKYRWSLQYVMLFVLMKDMTFIMIPPFPSLLIGGYYKYTFSMVNISVEIVNRFNTVFPPVCWTLLFYAALSWCVGIAVDLPHGVAWCALFLVYSHAKDASCFKLYF